MEDPVPRAREAAEEGQLADDIALDPASIVDADPGAELAGKHRHQDRDGQHDKSRDRERGTDRHRDRDKDRERGKHRRKDKHKDRDEHHDRDRRHRSKDDKRAASPVAGERKRDRERSPGEPRDAENDLKRSRSESGRSADERARQPAMSQRREPPARDVRPRVGDRRNDEAPRERVDRGGRGRYDREAERPAARQRDAERGGGYRDRDRDRARDSDRGGRVQAQARADARDSGRDRDTEGAERPARSSAERTTPAGAPDRERAAANGAAAGIDQARNGLRDHAERSAVDADTAHAKKGADDSDGEVKEEPASAAAANGAAASGVGSNAGPMSLEEVLQRKKAADEEAAKPKFMSRAERAALALEKRNKQSQAMRAQADAMRAAARDYEPGAHNNGAAAARPRGQPSESHVEAKAREREQELIRQNYLGKPHEKRRITKASDKFKFNFDWDAKEDTSQEKLHEGALLFGRGLRAGVDQRAQREALAKSEQTYLNQMRKARGEHTSDADVAADINRAQRAAHVDDDPNLKQKHWSEKPREAMTTRDWRIFREDHRMSVKNAGPNAPLPFRNWDEMPLAPPLRKAIADNGYEMPSPIQMSSMPYGLRQRDVIGLAETGSGKTAAFVLPMLIYIMGQPEMTEAVAADGPYALVLAPTRELAQQIEEEITKLAKYTPYRSCCIVGGTSYEDQIGQLRRGAEIVVATPGRLLDCLRRSYAVLNQCKYVVLDEADRMIDLGFEPQVIEVLAAMPSSNLKPADESDEITLDHTYRTTYMFSATMPPAVERIAKRYLRRPVVVTVGSAGKATDSVKQRVEWTDKKSKPALLLREIHRFQQGVEHLDRTEDGFKVIVFVNNRENSEEVYNSLARPGIFNVALLHGGKSQEQRQECIKGFREGEYDIMIATDVAGRGIDVKDVGMVLNYDMPHTIESYTHRIGRTGRAGKTGVAVTFLTASDDKVFYDLKQLLDASKVPVPPQLANHESAKIKPGGFETSRKDTTLYAQ